MMTEAEGRIAVVAEAMTWLGTPWRHRAALKGVGIDCGQFPLKVYANCGLIDPNYDTGEYPVDWHVHRVVERYIPIVEVFAREIDVADVQPGDLIVYRIGRVFSHGVIVTAFPQGIHSAIKERGVVLCDMDRDVGLISYPSRCFTLKAWPDGR